MSLLNERTHHHLESCQGIKCEPLSPAAEVQEMERSERQGTDSGKLQLKWPVLQKGQREEKKGRERNLYTKTLRSHVNFYRMGSTKLWCLWMHMYVIK